MRAVLRVIDGVTPARSSKQFNPSIGVPSTLELLVIDLIDGGKER